MVEDATQQVSIEDDGSLLNTVGQLEAALPPTTTSRNDPSVEQTTRDADEEAEQTTTSATEAAALAVAAVPMEGLLLWKVLEFALDISDYLKLSLVNKEWHATVQRVQPPIVMKLKRHLRGCHRKRAEAGLTMPHVLKLLQTVFEMLKSRDCPLYDRKQQQKQHSRSNNNAVNNATNNRHSSWPRVQPQHMIILCRFVHEFAKDGDEGYPRYNELRQMALRFVEATARETVQKMSEILAAAVSNNNNSSNSANDSDNNNNKPAAPHETLAQLVQRWQAYEGVADTVHRIVHYESHDNSRTNPDATPPVNVLEQSVPIGARTLTEQLLLSAAFRKNVAKFVAQQLAVAEFETPEQRAVLWQAAQLAQRYQRPVRAANNTDKISSLVNFISNLGPRVTPALELARQDEQERTAAATATPTPADAFVSLQTRKNQVRRVPTDSRLLQDLKFLQRLQLQAGDHLDVRHVNDAALDFLMNQFFVLPGPIPLVPVGDLNNGTCSADIVGPAYGNLMDSLDSDFLQCLLGASSYLDCQPLLDLGSLSLTFRMTGMSAEQIRVLLNIPPLTEEERAGMPDWLREADEGDAAPPN